MKLLFASRYFLSKFAAVVAVLFLLSSSFNGFAQNPTVINDSLVVNNRVYAKEKLIVDKEAKFKEDIKVLGTARLVGDLIVSGTAKFNGNVKMENLGITALTDSSEIIVILPNGQLKKGNLGNILQESLPPADLDYCGAEGGIPKWWAGTNKLFTGCDETNVGIATYHPLHKLHVVGVNYARSFLAGNVNATTAALVNAYATNNSQTLINLGVKIGTGAEDVRFTITNKGEIKATNIGTGPTLTINNGTGHAVVAYASDGTKILQLQNDGKLYSRGVIVNLNTWADYVFKPGYEMKTLKETETFISENGHLPGVPNETEIKEEGLDLGEMQRIQMEKIEEMYLHMIDMNNQILDLKKEVSLLKEENSQLKK